ncbi:MAG: asparaginase domain-containing protein [Mariprofundaceae bacterium]|nr:asparaginase domain-containing protein [Mariprofundaceae bacterium]
MKILVVFTGGTIGSSKSDSVIDINEAMSFQLLASYQTQANSKAVEFDTQQPIYTLSENLVPNDWHALLDSLNAVDQSIYHGIIIAHGTDTLPYTSAAVSFAMQQCHIPVVLVASGHPLDDVRANGQRNFSSAVDFIAEGVSKGVFVIYENKAGESIVHLGSRLVEADAYTDDFDSMGGVIFGKMEEGCFIHNTDARNPTAHDLNQHKPVLSTRIRFSSEILLIKPFTGLNYDYFRFGEHKPKAILHSLYHSGTANSSDDLSSSIKTFVSYCKQQGVDVYAAPIAQTEDLYQSAKDLMDAGAIPVIGVSLETTLVKLLMKCASEHLDMKTEIYFEKLRIMSPHSPSS